MERDLKFANMQNRILKLFAQLWNPKNVCQSRDCTLKPYKTLKLYTEAIQISRLCTEGTQTRDWTLKPYKSRDCALKAHKLEIGH